MTEEKEKVSAIELRDILLHSATRLERIEKRLNFLTDAVKDEELEED